MTDLPDWVDSDEWRDTSMAARCRFGFAWADLLDSLADAFDGCRIPILRDWVVVWRTKAQTIRHVWGEEPW